jgi:hypothetical protein
MSGIHGVEAIHDDAAVKKVPSVRCLEERLYSTIAGHVLETGESFPSTLAKRGAALQRVLESGESWD